MRTGFMGQLLAALAVVASVVAGGCSTPDCAEHVLALEPAPWFGGPERAKFVVCWEQRWASEAKYASFRWQNGIGEVVEYEEIAPVLHEFLRRSPLRRAPHQLDGPRPVPPFSYWEHGGLQPPGSQILRPAWFIVALKPLVLIRVDCEVSDVHSPDFRLDGQGGLSSRME